ncbi:unnamed protein product [Caenorhabditis brenneri]
MDKRKMKEKDKEWIRRQKVIKKLYLLEKAIHEKLKERAREEERMLFNERILWYKGHGPRTPCSSPPPSPPTTGSSADSTPSTSSGGST